MVRVPRVSVVLPAYNHAPFVAQAIESVLSQSFDDFELIITDDGSTDGTADRIRTFSDPRIRFEALPVNGGYSSALNASLARTRGELVALHCSDDIFLPGKLERQVAFLDGNPEVAAVFGKPVFVDKDTRPYPPHGNPFHGSFIDDPGSRSAWLRFFLLRGNALCHPTALVRRAVFDEVGEYDPLLVQLQDYDLWVRVCAAHEIRVLDEPLIGYRVLGDGLNTSWPTAEAVRRSAWETQRVLRRFLAFDAAVIARAFGTDFAELGLPANCPPRAALGRLLAARAEDAPRQAFALKLLDEAAERGEEGIDRSTLVSLTGSLDPFGLDRLAHAERRATEAEALERQAGEQCRAAERRAAETEALTRQAEEQRRAAERRATEAEALASAVRSSTTWRAMAPLRQLVNGWRSVRSGTPGALRLKAGGPAREASAAKRRDEALAMASAGAVGNATGEATDGPPHLAPCPSGATAGPEAVPMAVQQPAAAAPLPEWEYVAEGWRPDDPRGAGWEHPSIAETQLVKWPVFVEAVRSTKPLGVYHEAAQIDSETPAAHNFVLSFAYVLARTAAGRSSLSVLDWGGGLGHYAVIARSVLPEVTIDYTVFDLPGVCAAGRRVLPDIRFTSDAEDGLSRRYDLVFASGSLQYAEDWRGLLGRFAASANRWVFLSRTPFVDASPAFVVVQRPHSAGGYRTEYLSRVFNRPELLAEAGARGLTLEREFLMINERVAALHAPEPFEYRGFLFSARDPT
ncbi:methyltransferase, TIGR04325 family [Roseicella aquatilis]|uniref:Methyltransferase, TIGR04325 family n=1 Tax=Roseicella aquatilis TaxID=2527868 RepID=A0A4R4D4B9_9PROT|nr:methyltransferase, TIGR04325 family [Roseicella aquatilis]TCZ52907.1 methyltransferase, TIGR04325 family [Roseicella aquatilis]